MSIILLTRPLAQAQPLAEKIHAQGMQTVIFPALTLVAVSDNALLPAIAERLDSFDFILFISPAAVQFMQPWITHKPRATLLAVGADTAQAIEQQGWGRALYPTAFHREALLALPILHTVAGKAILICQGKDSNSTLAQTLRQRGAAVTLAECYQRQLPQPEILPDLASIDMVVCSSAASLENLVILLGKALYRKRLLVSSPRLQQIAQAAGFIYPPLLAANAGDDAILQALRAWQASTSPR